MWRGIDHITVYIRFGTNDRDVTRYKKCYIKRIPHPVPWNSFKIRINVSQAGSLKGKAQTLEAKSSAQLHVSKHIPQIKPSF